MTTATPPKPLSFAGFLAAKTLLTRHNLMHPADVAEIMHDLSTAGTPGIAEVSNRIAANADKINPNYALSIVTGMVAETAQMAREVVARYEQTTTPGSQADRLLAAIKGVPGARTALSGIIDPALATEAAGKFAQATPGPEREIKPVSTLRLVAAVTIA